jgi:hypothetical protein
VEQKQQSPLSPGVCTVAFAATRQSPPAVLPVVRLQLEFGGFTPVFVNSL